MSDATIDEDISAAGKIEFIQYHQPGLLADEYRITVRQEISTSGKVAQEIPAPVFSVTKSFLVAGERFEIKPEDVNAVFPPDGNLGEHSNVLPHVVLNRSTLPWERNAREAGNAEVPWLTLLLFDDAEKPTPRIITLGELRDTSAGAPKFPDVMLESGQLESDKVTVIDVAKSLLQTLMPTEDELALMTHVRQQKDAGGNPAGDELAVIIGNRLPLKGGGSTVHLVSVEERYQDGEFDYQGAADTDSIRLVTLKSWSFICADERQVFKTLLLHLNREPSTLRLPKNDSPDAEKYLSAGCVLLPHYLRQGETTASWYHGPLVTGENTTDTTLPARASDELLRYNPSNGMFDVSYAAAWEAGRLLALQSKQLSVSLYNWKRTHAQQLRQAEQRLLHPHLPVQGQTVETLQMPDDIVAWFDDLSLLKGVPFNYLVPDERMLPTESIRFFHIDRLWVDCLLDGAYSIGRVTTSDHQEDQVTVESAAANSYEKVSGCMMRSDVVAGWLGLLVDAYDRAEGGNRLELLRMERLSANVLLCLFEGEIGRVEVHQKPEALHFGFDRPDDATPAFHKKLRNAQGEEKNGKLDSIPWRNESARVVDVATLAREIQTETKLGFFTSAQFALQMIEGVEKVVFRGA